MKVSHAPTLSHTSWSISSLVADTCVHAVRCAAVFFGVSGADRTRGYVGLTALQRNGASTSAASEGELLRVGIKPDLTPPFLCPVPEKRCKRNCAYPKLSRCSPAAGLGSLHEVSA